MVFVKVMGGACLILPMATSDKGLRLFMKSGRACLRCCEVFAPKLCLHDLFLFFHLQPALADQCLNVVAFLKLGRLDQIFFVILFIIIENAKTVLLPHLIRASRNVPSLEFGLDLVQVCLTVQLLV